MSTSLCWNFEKVQNYCTVSDTCHKVITTCETWKHWRARWTHAPLAYIMNHLWTISKALCAATRWASRWGRSSFFFVICCFFFLKAQSSRRFLERHDRRMAEKSSAPSVAKLVQEAGSTSTSGGLPLRTFLYVLLSRDRVLGLPEARLYSSRENLYSSREKAFHVCLLPLHGMLPDAIFF